MGTPGGSAGKEFACSVEHLVDLKEDPRVRVETPLPGFSALENPQARQSMGSQRDTTKRSVAKKREGSLMLLGA